MPKRTALIKKLKEELAPDRFAHTLRVERVALSLARRHGVSTLKAGLAALLHDCARRYSRSRLLKEAARRGMKIDQFSRREPKLLHAELSARLARREFGVADRSVLRAISRHTLGTPGMNRLEKVVYLADHVEEGRDYRGLARLRRLAARDLDRAVGESADRTVRYLLDRGLPVHPGSLRTRNHYLFGL